MTSFFSKPVHTLDANDVADLVSTGLPESYTLEFKRSLPHKSGGMDPWDQHKNEIGEYARDKILAEVVALANAEGGCLVLGIDETNENPPRAKSIVTQRNVRELGRRFEDQARACIDPPIANFWIHPIETDGNNGVIVLKVAQSRLAPHRVSTTRDSFVRRGASTIKMNMREIQAMSIASTRRTDDLLLEFRAFQERFRNWRKLNELISFRITAIPLDRLPDSGRLYDPASPIPHFSIKRFEAKIGELASPLVIIAGSWSERPILRGIEGHATTSAGRLRIQRFQSGAIDLSFAHSGQFAGINGDHAVLYHGWLLGGVANVLQMISAHRLRVGMGDAEYGIEVEVMGLPTDSGSAPAYIELGDGHFGEGQHQLPTEKILLPVVSVAGPKEFDDVINVIDTDIFDALGVRRSPRSSIAVSW